MRKVKIIHEANVLERTGGSQLRKTGKFLTAGVEIEVGGPEWWWSYDDNVRMTFPFIMNGERFYILAKDIGEP